jgi:hypothetical protein
LKGAIRQRFFERYGTAFHLVDTSPFEAPSKPRAETGAGTRAETKPSVPNGTGADAPAEGLTAQESVFQIAVPWLVANGGKEGNVRSLLGGAVKQLGSEGAWEIASECMREKPIEPLAWLAAAVNARMKKVRASPAKPSRHNGFDKIDYSEGVTEDGRIV